MVIKQILEDTEATLDQVNTKATTLEEDNTRLVARIEVLQHDIADMECRTKELLNEKLVEKNTRLETENSIFHSDYVVQESRIKALEEEKSQLENDKETLQQDIATKESRINDLMANLSSKEVERDELIGEHAGYKGLMQHMHWTNRGRVEALMVEVQYLREELSEARGRVLTPSIRITKCR